MSRKITALSIFLLGSLLACSQNITQETGTKNNNFSTKKLESDLKPSISNWPISDLPPTGLKDVSEYVKYQGGDNNNANLVKPISFDDVPDESETMPGSISVIYKNSYKLNVDKKDHSIHALDDNTVLLVNNILKKYNVESVSDLAYPGVSESELDEDERRTSNFYHSEVPNRHSIQTYQFPTDVDTKKVAEELRRLPFVRTAYPSLVTKLTYVSSTMLTGSPAVSAPPDNYFSMNENTYWWWYNKHKIFQAWNYYGATQMPKIAILDSGFDNSSTAVDKPNYSSGMSVMFDPALYNPWVVIGGDIYEQNEVFPWPSGQETLSAGFYSHGTMTASVAGSPRSFSSPAPTNTGLSGVAYGANIYPIRVRNHHVNSIAHSIYQASYQGVDVINMSIGTSGQRPITYDPVVRSEFASAIARGIIVVISSGNGGDNSINPPPSPKPQINCGQDVSTDIEYIPPSCSAYTLSYPDSGEIIVGGSARDTTSGINHAWRGSTFGNRVNLTAAADDLYAPTFNPSVPSLGGYLDHHSGTSLAAPIVAAAAGMMKMIGPKDTSGNPKLTPRQIRSLIAYSGNLGRYNAVPTSGAETRFMGSRNPLLTIENQGSLWSIRDLNLFNALIVAKNVGNYQAITRLFNIDDGEQITDSYNWGNYYGYNTYGSDMLYGLNGLTSGTTINFRDYNAGGGVAQGYQVYRNYVNDAEYSAGVSGIVGANGSYLPGYWYAGWDYIY